MTLSCKTIKNIASALVPEVVEYIDNDERWVEFMMEIIPEAIESEMGKLDSDLMMNLSMCIMDRINLKTIN